MPALACTAFEPGNFPTIKIIKNYGHVRKIHKMGITVRVTDGMLKIIYSSPTFISSLVFYSNAAAAAAASATLAAHFMSAFEPTWRASYPTQCRTATDDDDDNDDRLTTTNCSSDWLWFQDVYRLSNVPTFHVAGSLTRRRAISYKCFGLKCLGYVRSVEYEGEPRNTLRYTKERWAEEKTEPHACESTWMTCIWPLDFTPMQQFCTPAAPPLAWLLSAWNSFTLIHPSQSSAYAKEHRCTRLNCVCQKFNTFQDSLITDMHVWMYQKRLTRRYMSHGDVLLLHCWSFVVGYLLCNLTTDSCSNINTRVCAKYLQHVCKSSNTLADTQHQEWVGHVARAR